MKCFRAVVVLLVASCCAVGAEPKLLPWKLLDEGWISLFDGRTLYGWQPVGDAKWAVVDGEIRTSGEKPGWLMTTTRWANFELHVEFKAAAKTNSGVFLRSALKPTDPNKDCYEVNIAAMDNPFPTGSLVARERADWGRGKFPAADKWHVIDVTASKGQLNVAVDGERVLTYTDAHPNLLGHIGLQANSGRVAFRNIRLKPLGLQSLFDGRDLNGWSLERTKKSKFTVTKDGELHLSKGPGQIETDQDFTNFVLQLECKVNGKGLNSGIFFRALRNKLMAGYESQIQNGYKDGDRTKPQDYGTGAIYRRQAARYVVANDGEWFTKTIVADGPHMAVWVDGYEVTDWTDTRPVKESARDGKRLGPGGIEIQGHDPTTDFLFRKIRVAELPR